MPQASGSQASISIWEEVAYGVRPVTPAMFKIKAATAGVTLKPVVEKLISKAITASRGIAASRGGNITVSGAIPFELPLLGIGKLIKHAIGTSVDTAVKMCTLGTGLTNVIVLCADTAAPAGAGTLTHTGSTLTWSAFGETAGAAVDITAGGDFVLQSSIASHALYILVTGAVVGASAAATVTATAAYKHVITRGALPVGFGAEIAYADIAQYQAFDGCRIDALDITIGNSGLVTGSMNVVAASSTVPTTVATGTPSSVAHSPFAQHEAMLMEGAVAAQMTAFSFNLTNGLDPVRAIGSRTIGSLREGMGDLNGKITTLFQDASRITRVLNETASSLYAYMAAANNAGCILFDLPNVKYYGDAGAGISTEKGIVQSNDFQADNSVGGADISVTIINSESTI